MKVLYVSSYYKPAYLYGGTVRCVSQLCEAMAALGAHVTVITTNVNGSDRLNIPLEQPVDVDGVEVVYYPVLGIPPQSYYFSPGLARACRREIGKYDIVVLQSLFSHGMQDATQACKRAGIPYVVQLHGQLLPWSIRHKRLKKQLFLSLRGRRYLNQAAAFHCTMPSEAEAADQLDIEAPKFVVPNGIDCNWFGNLPVRGLMRQQLRIPKDARLLLFLGRLHPKKRPDLAIQALAAAQSLLTEETHLLLAGPDELQMASQLQAQAHQLGCADRLHITGLLQPETILSAFADADLFLMPSEPESENFGMSAVEAMAAGLPILVSEGVPIGQWAEKAGAGLVVPCTTDAFCQATSELLAQPERLKEMGEHGQILVRERFEISSIARQMLTQYESIIETGRPRPDGSYES
jgi:glycosyltransferase involved in cell wall biosynthesis